MRVCIAQLNPTVADIKGNLQKLSAALKQAVEEKANLLVLPELFLSGYPPRDLLFRESFIQELLVAAEEVQKLSTQSPTVGILLGLPLKHSESAGNGLWNSARLIQNGKIIGEHHKALLPTYDVFDERRYFDSNTNIKPIPFQNSLLGVSICEDAWGEIGFSGRQRYDLNPIDKLSAFGAELFINLSASPFDLGKEKQRYDLILNHVRKHKKPFVYCNQVGGNDELVFDGRSFVINQHGEYIALLPAYEESVVTIDTASRTAIPAPETSELQSLHGALVLGLRDYMSKCNFPTALVGLSGGIDSAVVAAIAVEAVGKENVFGISMPTQYSSKGSVEDSRALAKNLGIAFEVIPIEKLFQDFLSELKAHFKNRAPDTTEENLQARIRGTLLMAFSNKFNHLLLTTGNKSELAVGYCTLYGDMTGGLGVIADVPKTKVYELAQHINRATKLIPEVILTKAPSAELRPDQKDEDSLPPYDVLDKVLEKYLNEGLSAGQIVALGIPEEIVYKVVNLVDRNEYKRRQAAPAIKISSKAFGSGRRMPIAVRYVHQ